MSTLTQGDIYQFRKLALKERDMVRTSYGDWVGVYSALALCLDHIVDANTKAKEAQP